MIQRSQSDHDHLTISDQYPKQLAPVGCLSRGGDTPVDVAALLKGGDVLRQSTYIRNHSNMIKHGNVYVTISISYINIYNIMAYSWHIHA